MKRQRELPLLNIFVNGRSLRSFDDFPVHAAAHGLADDLGIERVLNDFALGFDELAVWPGCSFFNPLRVIEQDTKVANLAHAGMHAARHLAGLEPRIAEDALLGFSCLPVEIDFLIRATRDAHSPALAFLLAHQHDSILAAFINGAGDRKSTRLNSSHPSISYAVFCLKKKK